MAGIRHSQRRVAFFSLALGALIAVTPAAALSSANDVWAAPVDISAPGAEEAHVAVDPQGNAIAVWQRGTGTSILIQAAIRPAGGRWQAPQDLSASGGTAYEPRVAVDPRGNAVAVWVLKVGTAFVTQAAEHPVGGGWQVPRSLSMPAPAAYGARVALDSRGDAVAVWSRKSGGSYVVQASVRPAGSSWQRPRNLSASGADGDNPQISVDPRGNAIATWSLQSSTDSVVQAAVRPARGAWQTPRSLSPAGGVAYRPQIAFGSKGDAVVVWVRRSGTSSAVHAAVRPRGRDWQTPQEVSLPGQETLAPQVAVGPNGAAVAVWSRDGGGGYVVQAAVRPAGGMWIVPRDLSAPGGGADGPQVGVDPGGDAVAAWRRRSATTFVVQAAALPSGGAWQTPQDVSQQGANLPSLAVDAEGNAVAVWPRPLATSTTIQAAGYDAAGPRLGSLRIPSQGRRGERLSFSVSPLDVWSGIGTTNWTFGDGAKANGARVSHTYGRAGRFRVRVTSEDGLGHTTTATRIVRVRG